MAMNGKTIPLNTFKTVDEIANLLRSTIAPAIEITVNTIPKMNAA